MKLFTQGNYLLNYEISNEDQIKATKQVQTLIPLGDYVLHGCGVL